MVNDHHAPGAPSVRAFTVGGGGCWRDEPHKSNLFWVGGPERGGEVREEKDLMKGLRGEVENGGRSPSSVLFGCVAATVAACESHA